MRRIIVTFLCLLLLFLLLLPCGALSLVTHTRYTYLGYQTLIIGEDEAPENFIHYQQIRSLGSFRKFNCIAGLPSYSYTLKDSANCFLKLQVIHSTYRFDSFVPDATYSLYDLAEEGDFRRLSPEAVPANDHGGSTSGLIEYENIQYRYDNDELSTILWVWNGVCFQLSATPSMKNISVTESYPIDRNTVMAKLLKSETAADALHALQGAMKKSAERYRIEAIRTRRNISLIVIGAIAVAVTTWLITYFIMRKKVKNAYRLGTNGGNLALAGSGTAPDGESSSSVSGASASPTSAEGIEAGAAPPEDTPTPPNAIP